MKLKTLFFLLFILILTSCSDEPKNNDTYNIDFQLPDNYLFYPRISVDATSGGLLHFTVQVEGVNGNAATGIFVMVKDTVNRTQILRLNTDNYCYTGSMQDIGNINLYTVILSSNYLKNDISVDVPYLRFQNKPAITMFRDEFGSSVLSGMSLNENKDVQVAWSSCGENTVYQINIRTSLQNIYTTTTDDLTVTIPGGALKQGSYLINIKAQKISGDPLFKDYNYYSVTTENSMDIAFNVF